jgi:hypothetical protein
MKVVLIIIFSILCFTSVGQFSDSLGLDNNPILNEAEAAYLNDNLQTQRADFDFHCKKILFAIGNNATTIVSKKEYFEEIRPWLIDKNKVSNYLLIFTYKEKQTANNFDAVVVAWTKIIVTTQRKAQLIQQLKNGQITGIWKPGLADVI